MIGAIVTGGITLLKDWFSHKQQIKQLDRKAEIKRKEAESEAAGSMDEHSRANITWEDNYLILLFTLPMVLLFIAPLLALFYPEAEKITPAVMAGFQALEQTPQAFQVGMLLIFVYVFGFRRLLHKAIDIGIGKIWKGG